MITKHQISANVRKERNMKVEDLFKMKVRNKKDGKIGVVTQGPEGICSAGEGLVFVEYEGTASLKKAPIIWLEVLEFVQPHIHPDCFDGNGKDCRFRDNRICCRYSGYEIDGRKRRPVAIFPACIRDHSGCDKHGG